MCKNLLLYLDSVKLELDKLLTTLLDYFGT